MGWLLALAVSTAAAQDEAADELQRFVGRMEVFNRMFPQEKVYLHFDNTGYFRGETMWFKAYVLRADNNHLTDMSRVLYVELLAPTGDVVETRKLRIENGQAQGSFRLDKLLGSGYYEVRAYTRYMMNWDGEAVSFSRVFPIFNAPKHEGDYSKPVIDQLNYRMRLPDNREGADEKLQRLNVRFYPEGGHLVAGLTTRVAFEVTDKEGAPTDTEGWLMAGEERLATVKTLREGRGTLECTPQTGQELTLLMGGRRFPLPAAEPQGCAMRVATEDDRVVVGVQASADWQGQPLGLALICGGNVDAFTSLTASGKRLMLGFSREEMSQGVNQLVLFSRDGTILAERMVFVYPQQGVDSIRISGTDSQPGPDGKLTLTAQARPKTTFSVAIRDYDTEVNGNTQDVATWLLLSSDLKGYISHPEYYLESDDDAHRQAADLLMMVQGWRRYDPRQMMTAQTLERQQPLEDGLYLYGKVSPTKKKQTVGGLSLKAVLYNRHGESQMGRTRTKADGSYAFNLPDCEGEWSLLLDTQQKDKKPEKLFVSIDRHFSPQARRLSHDETQPVPISQLPRRMAASQATDDDADVTEREHVLRNVTVKGRQRYKGARDAWENEGRGAYKASLYYNCDLAADAYGDHGEETPSILEWLKERNSFFDGDTEEINDKVGWHIDADNQIKEDLLRSSIHTDDSTTVKASLNGLYMGYPMEVPYYSKHMVHGSGLSYKNRPIVWILNNLFYAITQCPYSVTPVNLEHVTAFTVEQMPVDLAQYKSVYISEDNDIWTRYIMHSQLTGYSPVTVFLYTHHEKLQSTKGVRRTHFEGYTPTETYEMPGYVKLPPATDFRRTLYWNPSVSTDSRGQATISFYSSPACRNLIVSAEGVTPDGTAAVISK